MTTSPSWMPTLPADLAHAARETLLDIAGSLPEPGAEPTNASLGHGEAGFALFHGYIAQSSLVSSSQAEQHRERMFAHLQASVDKLGALNGRFDLLSGFMGPSWVANHLQCLGLIDDVEELCDTCDEAALDVLRQEGHELLCELVSGLSGIGVYGLARRHRPAGEKIVQDVASALSATTVRVDGLRTWFHSPDKLSSYSIETHPHGCFNLGLSHGVPGALVFMSRVGSDPDIRQLLREATEWLLRQRREYRNGSRYGYTFNDDPMHEPDGARLAWCYGDLGLAAALLGVARHAGNAAWEAAAVDLALNAARRTYEASGVVDAGLCHGAIGNAHIFMRLYRATGEQALLDAAHRWLREGLRMRVPGTGLAGFRAYCPLLPDETERPLWQPSSALVDGTCGIGLALLGMLTPTPPAWDEVLMLDIPALFH